MRGGLLLDTNIVIAVLEENFAVTSRIDPSIPLYVPCIAMGELYYGASHSGRVQHNLKRLTELASSLPVLDCNLATAAVYGSLRAELRKKGRPIPDNDIWIAAISQQTQLTLVSLDKHFQEFASLDVQIL